MYEITQKRSTIPLPDSKIEPTAKRKKKHEPLYFLQDVHLQRETVRPRRRCGGVDCPLHQLPRHSTAVSSAAPLRPNRQTFRSTRSNPPGCSRTPPSIFLPEIGVIDASVTPIITAIVPVIEPGDFTAAVRGAGGMSCLGLVEEGGGKGPLLVPNGRLRCHCIRGFGDEGGGG